ncbi:hypothetical protein GCM10009733_099560 [Nonomuraea maheshkhaliensis]|uniref:PPM-type phosphatase domain-containing protein n=1 Tax=Nonomuraea maheshkhaliensis TaxID=419590 RepID=A0ABN2HHA2_9ACTN
MTVFVITFLLGCLSVMTVRGRKGNWPAGMPVARPRLVAVGGTYEGTRGRPSDAYVVQERLIAAASGAVGAEAAHPAAALALGAVVTERPQHAGTMERDLRACAQAAHRAVRAAALRDPASPELASTLDLVVLDRTEIPRLRYAHIGDGGIWHCPKGGEPRLITTAWQGTGPRGVGLPAAEPEIGTLMLRPGDRIALVSDGAVRALGEGRMKQLLGGGASPSVCLDRLYDEMAAVEPKDDATVVVAEFVTA